MIRFPDFIRKNAFHRPDAKALHFEGHDYTWSQFSDRVHCMAQALRDLGVEPGDRVAYLGHNSGWMVEMYFVPSLIGALFVPMNFRLSEAEMVEMLADCTPEILIVDRHHGDRGAQLMALCPSLKHLIHADWDGPAPSLPPSTLNYETLASETARPEDDAFDAIASDSTDTKVLFYTSGTTGQPKGVMLSHLNMMTNSLGTGSIMEFGPEDVVMLSGPLFHLGTGSRIYTAAYYGATMIVQSRFEVIEAAALIKAHRVTSMTLVPTMLRMVLDHPDFGTFDFSSMRLLTYGAAPMPLPLMERALAAIPGVTFCQSYGMTEASPALTLLPPADHVPGNPRIDKLGSVGLPLPHSDIRIVDESGATLPPLEPGEIVARGSQIMNGYWGRDAETAEAMRGGFYHTGDAGYLDHDGYLFLVGRTKEMIISGGENVYPIETENCLSRHPAVAQAAVIGLPHEKWGETVHAVVALHPGQTVTTDELIAFCREHIAHYKAPRGVTFWDGALPLSATNKIDKTAIKTQLLAEVRA
ncbi:long-chain-fatty-acid--CoA ligase [Pseudooceanicola sp.]|uniref:long-chain-fatty-acid--CoA ligase n=1 Tax=Pseudooceanicola sp. TaxID=1914328 RepID=UPI00262A961E|nr:long-chain-fatty-acid--CoA ligase [Pseudooceanicola sp.]MDF1856824.1 long-chain-fatty-acid--CoA ligase [Pseudooceanicola sp.]